MNFPEETEIKETIQEKNEPQTTDNEIIVEKRVPQPIFQNIYPHIQNLKSLNILGILSQQKSLLIKNDISCMDWFSMGKRNFQVYFNSDDNKNLFFMASQENSCASEGYMLVYKSNGIIFASLGYQFNKGCCVNFCGSCNCECCKGNCCSCQNCCKNGGGFFLGGCCQNAGCFCLCDDGCCEGGCCHCCNCWCCEGGCCKMHCCKYGLYPCPGLIRIFLDVRFLNSMEEALKVDCGVYVGTISKPFNCWGDGYYGYYKVGERFAIIDTHCMRRNYILNIINRTYGSCCGKVIYNNPVCYGEEIFEITFPDDATPLEKFILISTLFMMDYEKCKCVLSKDKKYLTRKRKLLSGLTPDFI